MRKLFLFFSLAVLSLISCDREIPIEQVQEGEIQTITVIGPETIQFEPVTSALATKGTSVQDGNALLFNWAVGDTLGIFPSKGNQVEFPITEAQGSTSATFDGGGWALKNNASYAAYYPYSVWNYHRDNETILLDYSGQVQDGNGSFAHLSAYDFLASDKTEPQNGSVTFQMERQGSILYIDIVVPEPETITRLDILCDSGIFVAKAVLDISGETPLVRPTVMGSALTLYFKNTVTTQANETIRAYMAVQPVDFTNKTVTAKLHTESGIYTAPVTSRAVEKGRAAFLRFADDFTPEAIQFADANFKAYCVANFDRDGDGEITFAEAEAVREIEVYTDDITSLQGIEYFTNLEILKCTPLFNRSVSNGSGYTLYNNEEEVIGKLTSIDVYNNTLLHTLDCSGNQLTSLDVRNNTALTSLNCMYNHITSLDVRNNTALTSLACVNNQLTSLDVSNNTELISLGCGYNYLISLDVSNNTTLRSIYCQRNQLTSLDVSNNTALGSLECGSNQLTSLDVSNNTALRRLMCGSNQLTSLDVSNNTTLESLECGSNQLTSLDVSNNTALRSLRCLHNQLMSLDVSNNTALEAIYVQYNQLTSLDVRNNTVLIFLSCGNNQLSSLDMSNNIALSSLYCYSNQLTSLNISSNTILTTLDGKSNPTLTEIICMANTPPACVTETSFADTNNCPIYVPNESVDIYKAAEGWIYYANRIVGRDVNGTVVGPGPENPD